MPARSNNKFVNVYVNKKWKNKHSKRQRNNMTKHYDSNPHYTTIKDSINEYYDYQNDIPIWNCAVCSYCNIERLSYCTICNHSFYNKHTYTSINSRQYDLYFNGNDLLNILFYKNAPKSLQFVTKNKLNKILKSKLTTTIPHAFVPHLFTKYMNDITIKKFLNHFNRNIRIKKQYSILKKLYSKINNNTIWNINKISDTVNWTEFMYNKYNNKLSKHTFNSLNINKIFNNIESYKWGDIIEYKKHYNTFKDSINILSNNNIENVTCTCLNNNNMTIIKNLIHLNNSFISNSKTKNIHFFDLKQTDLVNISQSFILDTIKKHSKLFLCFKGSKNRNNLCIVPYITFNMNAIEMDISKCIIGKNKLNITFPNFKFIDINSINNLPLNVIQYDINYDLWCTFDEQCIDNLQRKYVLNIIESIIKLSIENNKQESEKDIYEIINENIEYFNDNYQEQYKIFENIKFKYIKCLYNQLIEKMECNMLNNDKQCYICLDLIHCTGQTMIKLECCNLLLHYECYKNLIQSKLELLNTTKNGNKITLKQMGCIMCKKQIKHKLSNNILENLNKKYNEIEPLALKQMRLIAGHTFENMLSYLFYKCNKCERMYFGGLNDCIEDFKEEKEEEKYERERVCIECMPKEMQNYKEHCSVHGDEYIQWKCCFCCSMATFRCGSTHFCEICHKPPGPSKLWNMQKNQKNELIQCPCISNRETHLPEKLMNTIECPLKIKHPPHGEEYCLGCAMCNEKDRIK